MSDEPKKYWETEVFDLEATIDAQRNSMLAVAKISNVFLEGLNDTLTLPEIKSEAAEAGHHLLGCNVWAAMFLLASILHDAKDGPPEALEIIDTILRDHLVHYATHVVRQRGPIGTCACDGEEFTHG